MIQEIMNYFEGISSLHRSFILVGGITLFWLLEVIFPLFKSIALQIDIFEKNIKRRKNILNFNFIFFFD